MRRHKDTCELTIKDLQKQRNISEISVAPPPCVWSIKPATILTTLSKETSYKSLLKYQKKPCIKTTKTRAKTTAQ